jgi:hypothetical protein
MGRVVFRTQVARIPRLPLFCGALANIISGFFLSPYPSFFVFSSLQVAGWPLGSSSAQSVLPTFG